MTNQTGTVVPKVVWYLLAAVVGGITLIIIGIIFIDISIPSIPNLSTFWWIVLIVVILIILGYLLRGKFFSISSFSKIISKELWYALGTIIVIYAAVFIWNLFAVSINRWPWDIDPASVPRSRISLRSTINDSEQARVRKNSTPTDTRIPLEMNTYQLLKAGTKYRWERACLTEYYFRIKEVGRVGLAYQFDDNSTLHYKGTMIKDTEDARFVPDQGEEEPFVAGTYTVTVDKDALVKFIAIKK